MIILEFFAMIVVIDEIAYYGRYYGQDIDHDPYNWWFCLFDYKCYNLDELQEFGFDYDDLNYDNGYIPLFRTDVSLLAKQFLSYQVKSDYQPIISKYDDFFIAFNVYLDHYSKGCEWHLFEKGSLKRDAIKWCKDYHLRWK